MLRPQVFALQEGDFQVGLICSEKQAIDATLESLAAEDPRFGTVADRYWNARGGSYTDGGAFIFTIGEADGGHAMTCTDKFGREIGVPADKAPYDFQLCACRRPAFENGRRPTLRKRWPGMRTSCSAISADGLASWNFEEVRSRLASLVESGSSDKAKPAVIELLTRLLDRRYPTGGKRRRSLLQMIQGSLDEIFRSVPLLADAEKAAYVRCDFACRDTLRRPKRGEKVLVTGRRRFPG